VPKKWPPAADVGIDGFPTDDPLELRMVVKKKKASSEP